MISVFYGDDTYRSREAFRSAREAAAARGGSPSLLRDERLTPATLHAVLGGTTLFGVPPAVAVERLTALTGASAIAVRDMLQTMPDDAVVLVWEDGVPAANGIVWRALQAVADLQHFPELDEAGVLAWVSERAAAQGKTLDAEAQRLLLAQCGNNLWLLASELEKVMLATDADRVTAADVGGVAAATPTAEIFSVVRAIVHGDAAEALRALTAGTLSGEEPRRIFFLVLRELSALRRVRSQLEQRKSLTAWDIARDLHLPKVAADQLLQTARQASSTALRTLFDRAVVAYYHLNMGRADTQEILESLALGNSQRART